MDYQIDTKIYFLLMKLVWPASNPDRV